MFAPGTLVLNRYRIVGLLGRGGMGEVYRADDLTLGQPVALKFLPKRFSETESRRQRFLNEVRVAREVAHPNVCRVYDVGEVDGLVFLSMEFVDGDDLSSLLRRIGRLPHEKAVEIARQLCAGLAALHDRDVLHRDLKPANVMVDGRGRVRLTDFGLAGLAAELAEGDIRSGTPGYMAPEQLDGREVTARSDIYSLGLVLYEVFSGKRAFEADTLAELTQMHREATPTSLSTLVSDLDPAVERVIARCLEKDPSMRPPSAIGVATALPGGDPLAAALAAGETPSPELVAAAGGGGGIHPLLGFACLAVMLVAVFAYSSFQTRYRLHSHVPFEKTADALEDRARELVATLNLDTNPADRAHGFVRHGDILNYIADSDSSQARWDSLILRRPAAVRYWYRQSPSPLVPLSANSNASLRDPEFRLAGMVTILMDPRGQLLEFRTVPVEFPDSTATTDDFDWTPLFNAAGIDTARVSPTSPAWFSRSNSDRQWSWKGTFEDPWNTPFQIEAGALQGKPVFFVVRGPWSRPERTVSSNSSTDVAGRIVNVIFLSVLGMAVFMAQRNMRTGRGDLSGTLRLALFVFALPMVGWLVGGQLGGPNDIIERFFAALGFSMVFAGITGCFYLALEPYVRKVWPTMVIAWNRLLRGRVRDRMVGRSILAAGVGFAFSVGLSFVQRAFMENSGVPPSIPQSMRWTSLMGPVSLFTDFVNLILNSLLNPIFFAVFLVVLRMITRRAWAAIGVFTLIVIIAAGGSSDVFWHGALVGGLLATLWMTLLVRFGLLSLIVYWMFDNIVDYFPITFGSYGLLEAPSVLTVGFLVGLTLFGLYAALAGRSVLGDDF